VVGIYLGKNPEILFGELDPSKYRRLYGLNTIINKNLWTVQLNSITYDKTQILPSVITAAIMLNTPFIIVPRATVMVILSKIEQATGKKCKIDDASNTCSCNVNDYDYSVFKDLEFDFGAGYTFSIPATSYVRFAKINDQILAYLLIMAPPKINYLGLGTAFFENYYLALNGETDTVSFGPLF